MAQRLPRARIVLACLLMLAALCKAEDLPDNWSASDYTHLRSIYQSLYGVPFDRPNSKFCDENEIQASGRQTNSQPHFWACHVTVASINVFERSFPSSSRISPDVAKLSKLHTLQLLAIPEGELGVVDEAVPSGGGTIPTELASTPSLGGIVLTRMPLQGTIPTELANAKLISLSLSHTNLVGTIPAELGGVDTLFGFSLLYSAGITGAIPDFTNTKLKSVSINGVQKLGGSTKSFPDSIQSCIILNTQIKDDNEDVNCVVTNFDAPPAAESAAQPLARSPLPLVLAPFLALLFLL